MILASQFKSFLQPLALGLGEGSEQRAPMGQSVIGGVITSSLLTLVVVPECPFEACFVLQAKASLVLRSDLRRHILNQTVMLKGNNMLRKSLLAILFVLFGNLADADVQTIREATRGELLYSTHCIACHNTQLHWRDKKLVTDWTSLQAEVLRWQGVSGLGWVDDDVAEVARYLNALYYHFPTPD